MELLSQEIILTSLVKSFTLQPAQCHRLISNKGGAICGSFLAFGGLSVLLYKPWRRRIDRRRKVRHQPQQALDGEEVEMTNGIAASQVDGKQAVEDVERIRSQSMEMSMTGPSRGSMPKDSG